MLPDVGEDRMKRFLEEFLVDPVPHLLADFLGLEDAGIAKAVQVVRDRRTRERRDLDDLAHVQALALLEGEEDSLAVLVAQRREGPRDDSPFARDRPEVVSIHNHILSYIVTISQPWPRRDTLFPLKNGCHSDS